MIYMPNKFFNRNTALSLAVLSLCCACLGVACMYEAGSVCVSWFMLYTVHCIQAQKNRPGSFATSGRKTYEKLLFYKSLYIFRHT